MTNLLKRLRRRKERLQKKMWKLNRPKNRARRSPKSHSRQNLSLRESHQVSRCLGSIGIGCWFTLHSFKSVSLITGVGPSTSADARDLIDVTDPVRKIASQAMAELNLNLPLQGTAKLNQPTTFNTDEKAKQCVKTAMGLLTDLSEVPDYISTSALKKRVIQSGNRSFFWHVLSTSNMTILVRFGSYISLLGNFSETGDPEVQQ